MYCFKKIFTKKQPSAATNPATKLGSIFYGSIIKGLSTEFIKGNASFSSAPFTDVNPLFITSLKATIYWAPSKVKCSFRSIIYTARLNNSKSACF